MATKAPYIPATTRLIWFTAAAMAILFALPRLAVLFHLQQWPRMAPGLADFGMRTLYTFLLATIFLWINLRPAPPAGRFVWHNPRRLYQKILYQVVLFLLLDIVFLRLHLSLFDPFLQEKIFRFLFNMTHILVAMLAIFLASIYRLLFRNQQMKLVNEQLRKANAESRYEVLMNQVNPHFLFNSFNTVNALIHTDQQEAIHYVNNMSDVFRYVLESSRRDLVTLQEELQFLEAYTGMLQGRYGSKLQVALDIRTEALPLLLPPMALQILVENAVKHNVISARTPLRIDIYLSDARELAVVNLLREKKQRPASTGIGLANLNQRCQYLSGRSLRIRRTEVEFFVTLPLIAHGTRVNH